MNKNLSSAIKTVKKGGVIIFPTDTAFGIGCRIDDSDAVRRVFKIRNRPSEKAVPVLISSQKMANDYFSQVPADVKKMMDKYWPGGLTIVADCKLNKVVAPVRGNGKTVGLRVPKHRTIRALISKVGVPIVGCSANFAGGPTPYKMSDLDSELIKLVDLVLPGRCSSKRSSTVVDVTNKPFKILRQGAVNLKL